jgi:hypothetical protein
LFGPLPDRTLRIAVFRLGTGLLCALLLLLAGCSDGGSSNGPVFPDNDTPDAIVTPVTPVPQPPGIPGTAPPLTSTAQLGRINRFAGEPPEGVATRSLNNASCQDGLLTLETSSETIYAALDCGSFWDEQTAPHFLGQQAALTLEAGSSRFRILIETIDGAQAEFTVGGVWIQPL